MALLIIRASVKLVIFHEFIVDHYILGVVGNEHTILFARFLKLHQELSNAMEVRFVYVPYEPKTDGDEARRREKTILRQENLN